MRIPFLSGFLLIAALLLSGCGPTKNYPQAADLIGTYKGQTGIIGVISMTISQDSEGFLCFDTSCGYSGKLKVVKAQGKALGQPSWNDNIATGYTLKTMDEQRSGRASKEGISMTQIDLYRYNSAQGESGYTSKLDLVLSPWGKIIQLYR